MGVKYIFPGLNPDIGLMPGVGKSKGGTLSRRQKWEYVNTEKYKIKKFFNEREDGVVARVDNRDSYYVSMDPVFESHIKKDFLKESMIKSRKPGVLNLKGIPLGITEDDKLICLPENDEMPTWFICGQVGMGKTILSHRLVDYFYNLWNYNTMILNDWKSETIYWKYPSYEKNLKILREHPGVGLPLIHIFPKMKNSIKRRDKQVRMDYGLDWEDFIEKIEYFADLGASEKYLIEAKKDLLNVSNMEEFRLRLREILPGKEPARIRAKIISTFEKYHEMGLLNPNVRLTDYYNDKCGVGKITIMQDDKILLEPEHPFISLSRLGVVPVINTSDLNIYEESYQRIMNYWINSIINKKNLDNTYKKTPLILYIDELSSFIGRKKPYAIMAIKNMVQRGRTLKIGAVLTTQNISEIPSEIVANCKYHAVFAMPSDKDTTIISRNLNLDRSYKNMIKELNKFECLLISREKPFLVYDLEENKYEDRTGIFKVRIFFSLGMHEGSPNLNVSDKFHNAVTTDIRYRNGSLVETQAESAYNNYPLKILYDNNIKVLIKKDAMKRQDSGEFNNLFYVRDANIIKDALNQKETFFKNPRLIEGISLSKYFYRKKNETVTISYSELQKLGMVIVTLRTGYMTIRKIGNTRDSMFKHRSLPKEILYITYNPFTKQARLIGDKVYNETIYIEGYPLIERNK